MCLCVCVCVYECVFDKGCVIYLSNVRISDNATPVSRLAETVVMTTLANNLSDLGSLSLREREVLETEEQRGVFFLFVCRVVVIDQESNPCRSVQRPNALRTQTRKRWKAMEGKKERLK